MTSLHVALVLLCVCAAVLLLVIAALSRHKKSAHAPLNLVGARARVEDELAPEGSVIAEGELWRARTRTGEPLRCGRSVRIVGASGHLLEVEPTD